MRAPFKKGTWATLPLAPGVIAFGLLYGPMAQQVGFSPWEALAMSAIVHAGSAQSVRGDAGRLSRMDGRCGFEQHRASRPHPLDEGGLAAARHAPTANNDQPWRFLVVRERDSLDRLRLRLEPWLRQRMEAATSDAEARAARAPGVRDLPSDYVLRGGCSVRPLWRPGGVASHLCPAPGSPGQVAAEATEETTGRAGAI